MKTGLLKLDLRSADGEFTIPVVLSGESSLEEQAQDYLMDFWGEAEEEDGSEWVTYPNGVIGRIASVHPTTAEEHEVLSRFL